MPSERFDLCVVALGLVGSTLTSGRSARAQVGVAQTTHVQPDAEGASAPATVAPTAVLPLPPTADAHLRLPQPANWEVPIWHSVGLLTTMRVGEAYLWPDPFAETDLGVIGGHYAEAFTRPPKWDGERSAFEWDGDRWWINAIGHPLLGSELYYRPRRCGHGPWTALAFAAAGSTLWEYGYEASGVRPSGLDLWFTPLSGALLGEVRFWGYAAAGAIRQPTIRVVVQTLIDPFGQIERALTTHC